VRDMREKVIEGEIKWEILKGKKKDFKSLTNPYWFLVIKR
jgi:hypothetical protein